MIAANMEVKRSRLIHVRVYQPHGTISVYSLTNFIADEGRSQMSFGF